MSERKPCALERFQINDIDAVVTDFGSVDVRENDDSNGCAGAVFNRDEEFKDAAKEKYQITDEEFNEVCEELESLINIGSCYDCW